MSVMTSLETEFPLESALCCFQTINDLFFLGYYNGKLYTMRRYGAQDEISMKAIKAFTYIRNEAGTFYMIRKNDSVELERKCENCGSPREPEQHECDKCGWEFGFSGGGLDKLHCEEPPLLEEQIDWLKVEIDEMARKSIGLSDYGNYKIMLFKSIYQSLLALKLTQP